jgi:hypothetical protein
MATKDDTTEIKFTALRHCIGILGLLLPWLVLVIARIFDDCDCLQDSISHYYFTVAGPCFTAILFGLGLTLLFYPTPKSRTGLPAPSACKWRVCRLISGDHDGLLTSVSGFCAILVALIPTDAYSNDDCAIFHFEPHPLRTSLHYAAAALMLLIFSYMSVCIFTRTNDPNWKQNKWKRTRNTIYIWCGVLTFLSILTIGVLAILEHYFYVNVYHKSTYWLEVAALIPFGVSWLVKGGFIFTDEGDESTVEKVANIVPGKK